MLKRTGFVCALIFAGCATAPKGDAKTPSAGAMCSIAEPSWAAATRDYDRRVTSESIAGLVDAAKADREKLHAGARGDIGQGVDTLFRNPPSTTAFVKGGVAELGTRLRQLDCAVQSGRVSFEIADKLYGQILAELDAERAAVDPGAGSVRAVSP